MWINHNDYQAATIFIRQISDTRETAQHVMNTLEWIRDNPNTGRVRRDLVQHYIEDLVDLLNNPWFDSFHRPSSFLDTIFDEAVKTHNLMKEQE